MTPVSISDLSRLTGMARKTISKRLSKDGPKAENDGYRADDALRIIYSYETANIRLDRLNKTQLAKITGLAINTVSSRLEDALQGPDEDGLYATPKALAALYKADPPRSEDDEDPEETLEQKPEEPAPGQTNRLSYETHRTQYMRAKAEREQLALDKERGKYLLADEIKEHLGGVLRTLRTRLLAIPQRIVQTIAPGDSPKAIEQKIGQEVETALKELSRLKI